MAKQYKQALAGLIVAGALCGGAAVARADTILWIDDTSGNIGKVDLTTSSVTVVGNSGLGSNLTDIGFTSNGNLYGTTFTGLYSISTSNGSATPVGPGYGSVGSTGMNALVGNGTTLLGASNATNSIYTINPTTGVATVNGTYTSPAPSAGDLAFSGSTLYESATGAGSDDELIDASNGTDVGFFTVGGVKLTGVFGLADDGTTMYAVNGTDIYSVNLSNADLTLVDPYVGHGLSDANGTAFVGEGSTPVPEPASLTLLGSALIGLGALRRRRRKAA